MSIQTSTPSKSSTSALQRLVASQQKCKVQPDARGENGDPCFSSTGDARLDLFFSGLVRGADDAKLRRMMHSSWLTSAKHTVQLLMHARDCRGGKGERLVVQHCLLWLREHHTKTYLMNIDAMVACGYFKDLVNIALVAHERKLPKLGEFDLVELEVLADYLVADMAKLAAHMQEENNSDQEDDEMKAEDEDADFVLVGEPSCKEQKKPKKRSGVSLAAKWAPTIGSSADKKCKLAKRLARLIFPDTKTAFKDYRTKVLTPLRAHLQVVERLLCTDQWGDINFGAVPSRAHHRLKKAFARHQPERYQAFLDKVEKGEAKINTGVLHPHEVCGQYIDRKFNAADQVTELQWRTILDGLRASSGAETLGQAVALVDVSGSMSGIPMTVAITLGIIVSELADKSTPYHRRMLTFSSSPQWHRVTGDSLFKQVQGVKAMDWGMNTNIRAAFSKILDSAVKHKTPAAAMPKTLFIFSDMQFDYATTEPFSSTHESASAAFKRHGYDLPRIVYWNLRGDANGFPVTMGEKGTSLISGFSADLLKLFLAGDDFTPLAVMLRAISKYPAEVHPDEVGRAGMVE